MYLLKLAFRERGVIIIQKFLAVEGLEALQDPVSNPTGSNCTNNFTLEIESIPSDLGDIPFAALYHFVSGHKVPDEQEDRHHNVLCD